MPNQKYEDCISRFYDNWLFEMEGKRNQMDVDHSEKVEKYCRSAYKGKYESEDKRRKELKKQVTTLTENQYWKVRDIFGEEVDKMTDELKE